MRKIFILCVLLQLIILPVAISQDFSKIDRYAEKTPKAVTKTPETLAKYLNKEAVTDLEKVRAYYVWIGKNIHYDVHGFFSGNIKSPSAQKTLKQRKSVCQGYAELFKAMCDYSQIPNYIVSGYSKGYGFNPNRRITNPDHAWNVVKINNQWQLIDVTWSSGYVNEKKQFKQKFTFEFFLSNPHDFILKHLPSDPMWQLLSCPISVKDFRKSDEDLKKQLKTASKNCFNYNDTIAAFEKLSPINQKVNTAERAYRYNPDNYEVPGFAYLNLAYELSQDIAVLYEKKDYQAALALNKKILDINKRALYYLRKSNSDQSKNAVTICKKNIAQLKNAIKSLEDFLD